MSSHSRITIPPECGFVTWLANTYGSWTIAKTRSTIDLDRYLYDLNACKKFETWGLDIGSLKHAIMNSEPVNYSELSSCVYMSFIEQFDPQSVRWGDKNNYHVKLIPEIDRIYPRCKFIHVCRDVRDVACSYKALKTRSFNSQYAPQLPGDVKGIANDWKSNVGQVLEDFANIAPDRKLTIQYEQLVRNPENELSKACELLAENFESNMLNFYKNSLEPESTIDWKTKTKSPIDQKSVGSFLRGLTTEEIEFFNKTCGKLMRKLGYEIE